MQGATRQGDVNPVGAGRVCTRGCGIGRGTAGHKRDVGRGRGRGRARNNSGNVAAAVSYTHLTLPTIYSV